MRRRIRGRIFSSLRATDWLCYRVDVLDRRGLVTDKLRQAVAQMPFLGRALGLVWAAAPGWTVAAAALLLVQGLLPVAGVYLVRALVDGLVAALAAGGAWSSVQPVLGVAGLLAGVMVLTQALGSVSGWVRTAQAELVQDHITAVVQEKSCAVDLAFYDSPDYYDEMHRARAEAVTRPQMLVENLGGLLQSGVSLVAMGGVLLPYGAWLPLALLVSTVPAFGVVLRYAVRNYEWRHRVTEDQRRAWYYDWILRERDTAQEVRLFGLGRHFQSAYGSLRSRLRNERMRVARDQVVWDLAAGGFALLVTGVAMAWVGWRVLKGNRTLGDLALFYQAFNTGQGLMRSLLGNVGQIYANSLFLGDLFAFIGLEPRVVDRSDARAGPVAPTHELRFRDVVFRYPDSDRPVLERFNLVIPAGQVTAILGSNGAGKSTLLKLLCRFYDPEEGAVEVDGVDLRNLSLAELRRSIALLLQQPVHYNATARDNIALGQLEREPVAAEAIAASAEAAGAAELIARLPQGYDTLLGRWFAGGAELSVGEWQRIALARTFLRDAPLILLDEPTSAMDSWAERDWMDRFRGFARGRTAVIITHRLATARQADLIHVMERGRVVESGSHDDLIALDGRYAEAWRGQVGDWAGAKP
jgi:ATP-binding cassette, subfamily B, bacterial